MRNRLISQGVWALMLLPLALSGKEPKNKAEGLDLTQCCLVSECIASDVRKCVRNVLNPAGAAGYRFVAGDIQRRSFWYYSNPYLLVVMEKTGDHNTTYQYIQAPGTHEGLNEAAGRGFRLVPRFPVESWRHGNEELPCVLEKPSNSDLPYQYLVFSVSKSRGDAKASDLFQKMEEAVDKGYEIVQFKEIPRGYAVVLEKPLGGDSEPLPNLEDASKPATLPRYRLLLTWGGPDWRKELAAATGYRLVAGDLDGDALLLERIPGPSQSYEYVVATGRLRRTLERNAAKGFRLHPCSRGFKFVMERRSASTAFYQYQVLETVRLSTMRKELDEAVRKGFAVVMAIRYEEFQALVLERPR
jgi:hypothetical protein